MLRTTRLHTTWLRTTSPLLGDGQSLRRIGLVSLSLLLFVPLGAIAAPLRPERPTVTPVRPTAQPVRSRLKFRVGVRASRFRVGGFSRASKCADGAVLTSLVPPFNPGVDQKITERVGSRERETRAPIDTTMSPRPIFWLHVPKTTGAQAEFTLQDQGGRRQLYQTKFTLTNNQSGVVGIKLPESVSPLVVGQDYVWQVSVDCDPDRPDKALVLGSWIRRVDPAQLPAASDFNPRALVQQLTTANDQEKPSLYAALGIWQEAVSGLAQLRLKNPANAQIRQDWRDLMTQTRMEDFLKDEPVLQIF